MPRRRATLAMPGSGSLLRISRTRSAVDDACGARSRRVRHSARTVRPRRSSALFQVRNDGKQIDPLRRLQRRDSSVDFGRARLPSSAPRRILVACRCVMVGALPLDARPRLHFSQAGGVPTVEIGNRESRRTPSAMSAGCWLHRAWATGQETGTCPRSARHCARARADGRTRAYAPARVSWRRSDAT